MATVSQSICAASRNPVCRFCGQPLQRTFVDLGMSPLCESYLKPDKLNQMEPFYPLHVYVCETCLLVQLHEYASPEEIFTEYAYFSSFSDSWLRHCEDYAETMIRRFGLGSDSYVVEVASNDGYLLQYFVRRGIPALGIEPAKNVAEAAIGRGVPTDVRFFGTELAKELAAQGKRPDLLLGNNVLAQVPNLNDFVRGMKILLKPGGVITLEFPHLLKLIELNEFDTIYHEHFSYFSLYTIERVMEAHALKVFDVEELPTHGGSLRLYACHAEDGTRQRGPHAAVVAENERAAGLTAIGGYLSFAQKVKETKWALLEFLIAAKRERKSIAGYGAPGKGTTLFLYSGISRDFLDYTVDRNTYKHGRFMPGTHIPICHPDKIRETRPDFIFILPWNLKDEIMNQLSFIREWGGRFIVPIPKVAIE